MLTQEEINKKYEEWIYETLLFTESHKEEWNVTGKTSDDDEGMYNRFFQNAKKEGEANLYRRFLSKEYFEAGMGNLKEYFKANVPGVTTRFKMLMPALISRNPSQENKPSLYFFYPEWVALLGYSFTLMAEEDIKEIQKLFLSVDKEGANFEFYLKTNDKEYKELLEATMEIFKGKRTKYESVISLGKKSDYYLEIYKVYTNSKNMKIMDFKDFARRNHKYYTKLIQNLVGAEKFFQRPINIKKLLSCFENEKVSLCIVCSLLEEIQRREENNVSIDNLIIPLMNYSKLISEIKISQGESYNPTIADAEGHKDQNGKEFFLPKERTAKDIVEKINALTIKHFEFNFDNEEITAQWEIIPNGVQEELTGEGSNSPRGDGKVIETDRKKQKILESIRFFATSEPLYKMRGVDKFSGYHGHIYKNGKVIFEKFYEDEFTQQIAINNATYILTIHNFERLSRLEKAKLTRTLQTMSPAEGKKLNHSLTWRSRIEREVVGSNQTPLVENKVNELVERGLIVREEPKQKLKTKAG